MTLLDSARRLCELVEKATAGSYSPKAMNAYTGMAQWYCGDVAAALLRAVDVINDLAHHDGCWCPVRPADAETDAATPHEAECIATVALLRDLGALPASNSR